MYRLVLIKVASDKTQKNGSEEMKLSKLVVVVVILSLLLAACAKPVPPPRLNL